MVQFHLIELNDGLFYKTGKNEEELFDFLDKKDDVVYEYDGIYEDTFVHEHPELFVFDGTYTIPE